MGGWDASKAKLRVSVTSGKASLLYPEIRMVTVTVFDSGV